QGGPHPAPQPLERGRPRLLPRRQAEPGVEAADLRPPRHGGRRRVLLGQRGRRGHLLRRRHVLRPAHHLRDDLGARTGGAAAADAVRGSDAPGPVRSRRAHLGPAGLRDLPRQRGGAPRRAAGAGPHPGPTPGRQATAGRAGHRQGGVGLVPHECRRCPRDPAPLPAAREPDVEAGLRFRRPPDVRDPVNPKISLRIRFAPGPVPARFVASAEDLGLHGVWVNEPWGFDAGAVLGAIAATTRRVLLGTHIVSVYARTPAATAGLAAALQVLSDGRFRLALGTSGPQVVEGWHGVPFERPLARTRDTIAVVRAALAGEPVAYGGESVTLPLPGSRGKALRFSQLSEPLAVPIYVAALGP